MANTLNGFKVIGDTSMIGAGVKHGGAGQTSTASSANGENRTLNGFKVVGDTSKIGAKAKETKAVTPSASPQPMGNASAGKNNKSSAQKKSFFEIATQNKAPGRVAENAQPRQTSYAGQLGQVSRNAAAPNSRYNAGNLRTAQKQEVAAPSIGKDRSGQYSLRKGLESVALKGGQQIAQAAGNTAAFAEDLLLAPFELFSGQELGAISDTAPFNTWAKGIQRNGQELQEKYAENIAKGGKAAELFDTYGSATVAAVPQAVLALMTSGASEAGTAAGLASTAAKELSPSVLNTVRSAVTEAAKDPQYWISFGQVVGDGYEQALQDMQVSGRYDNNTARTKAALYAIGNGLLNAEVEVGGGIQTLPEELKHGAAAWKAWVDSMVDEGKEEVVQGVIERAMQNSVYHKGNPLASLSDENAILNPRTAAQEFAGGAIVGGILGGGQTFINSAINARNAPTAPQDAPGAQADVREGTYTPTEQIRAEGAQNAAPGVEAAENIRVGQATTIKKPYKGEVPTQTQRQNTAPVQVSSEALTQAQNRIAGARGLESSLPGQSFKSTLKNVYKSIFKPAKGVVVEGTSFGGQPYAVDIPNSVPGKVISDTNLTAEKLALLDNLPDVVRNGTYVGSGEYVPHGSKAKKTVRFDYFEAPVEINGKQYIASFDVEAFPDVNNYRTHKLNEIELSPMTNADTGRDPAANAMRTVPVEGTRPLNANDSIAQGAKNVKSDPLMDILFGKQGAEKVTDTPGDARYDNLGSARQGFTTPGMEGTERTSRFAESMPYNQWQEAATGLSREDYARIFRYESQTEGKSMHLAEELVYVMKDGKKTFLRDVDEGAFHELVQSLDDATAWNGPQTDAARMIQSELQGKSVDAEIPDTEYTDFLKIMREHSTSTGQGVQANAKWSRNDNNRGQSTELDAWNNLEKSKLSEAEKHDAFQKIVKWDTDIEAVKSGDTQAMKDIILDVANERGVLGGATRKIANKALDSLTFDQLKQFAYASTSAMSTDATPANAGRKAKTIQILSMLSNLKTPSKNIVGNTSFYLLDALSMKGGALLDTAVSKFTGTRSVANEKALSREAIHSAMKAANMSIAEIALDVDMGGDRSRYGTGSQRTFKMNGEGVFNTGTKVDKFGERVLSTLERNQAYLLNATDEFFKGAARNVEGSIQKLVDEGKIKTADKNYARNQAEQLAKYRTFQDNSKLSVVIQEVHDALNLWGFGDSGRKRNGRTIHSFGAGDIAAPFIRVAGNLVSRGAEYSPYNVIKGTGEIVGAAAKAAGGNTDVSLQAKGVSDFARGMTGTMVAAGFMAIAKMGLMRKADDEDDENVASLNRSEGMTGTQFNWSAFQRMLSGGDTQWQNGDTLIDISSIEPLNLLADLGAEMAKSDENPVISSFKATPKSLVDASSSLPVVQFLGDVGTDILKYGNDPIESISKEAASTLAASVVPNALRATAQGLDDRPRSTGYADTFAERLAMEAKSRIPGLRETLPGSVDTLGNERTYQGTTPERLFNSMLNPVGVNHYQQGELSKDLESLRERSGGNTSFYPTNRIPKEISFTDKSGKTHTAQMDYEQRQDFQRTRGTVTNGTMMAMTGTRAYKKASAERQVELMAKCQSYGYEVAKGGVLGKAAMESWAVNAQTSKKDVGLSTVEFLALYTDDRYKSYLSGKAYEKTKEAYRAGVSVEEYVGLKESADTNGNGTISKAEASAALAGQENRADLWDIICTTNAKNPYK